MPPCGALFMPHSRAARILIVATSDDPLRRWIARERLNSLNF
jgi:phage baseplate assembly protein W